MVPQFQLENFETETRLCRNVAELARGVHFETREYPEFGFPPILASTYRQRPSYYPLPRRKLPPKDCVAAPVRRDFAAPVAQAPPPFLRLCLARPFVDARATRGKFAYGFLAVLHYPVATILLLPGRLLEMRWIFPVEMANALQLPVQPPALVKLDLKVSPLSFRRFEELPALQVAPEFANALWTRSEKAKDLILKRFARLP